MLGREASTMNFTASRPCPAFECLIFPEIAANNLLYIGKHMTAKGVKESKKRRPRRPQTRPPLLVPVSRERTALAWTSLLFLLHGLGVTLLFSPIAGLVDNQPVIEQDWGLHFHHLSSMHAFWRVDQNLW